ncbi:hypothetical protein ABEB36_000495 [Hypothenemus hampei]|uniref:mTERF domain-containing protein 1, mitochondrial n=1 Tax=Hypothenemus hampei TaxID=57062 RepID=A0ABD1FBE4_HYPHA
MLKRIIHFSTLKISKTLCTSSQLSNSLENRTNDLTPSTLEPTEPESKSVLEPLNEDISHVTTYLKPTYNIAAYANRSETIQEFIKLGVDLNHIERKVSNAVPFILRLHFEEVKKHLLFFTNVGINIDDVAHLITKNPFILKESLEDLDVRINYLKFKRFTDESIARIITKNPFWLSYSTQDIDTKLGFFQATFELSGPQVRQIADQAPRLITHNQEKVKLNVFVLKEEMGFSKYDIQNIILKKPKILMSEQKKLLKTFEYLHKVIGLSHQQILECPQILTCRENRLKERHQFLVKMKRDQFNPKEPNFVNVITMVSGTDSEFSTEVAKSSVEEYNLFLKTL